MTEPLTPARLAELDALYARVPTDAKFYVEARVGSANHRGECVRCVWDGARFNEAAHDVINRLIRRVAELEAELATARAVNEDAEDAMRDLAFTLSAGGYNSPAFDVETFHKKISDGIDMLMKPMENRINELIAERDTLSASLEKAVELLRPLAATADWDDADPYARAAAAFIASEAAK